ncbi:hypothetical protein KDI_45890 [Dictyobacter arantiisoli]|uniref:Uncharacterized protein n=2 Tax=Dictyobacter arantiisoli TaxID=2014874 RepID=A0A5A5TIH5_9CHLR|nr:hypothetical protein KDI_45890 [Dictyobacter arantiisoli]
MSCTLKPRQQVSGMITDIIIPTAQPTLAVLRIDGDLQQDNRFKKFSVQVDQATQLLQENSDGISSILLSELKPGKRVLISFITNTRHRIPPVLKAIEVRLLPETE